MERPLPPDDGAALVRITVRLPAQAAEQLRRLAYAARLPPAAVARDLLVQALAEGRGPQPAPPAPAELDPAAAGLLRVLQGLAPCLGQLRAHAERLGPPISGAAGTLATLAAAVRALGLATRSGQVDGAAAARALACLQAPADAVNLDLARPLNVGLQPPPATWASAIRALTDALAEGAP